MEELFDYDGHRNPPDDGGILNCPSNPPRGRGRPKKVDAPQVEWDVRITPIDGKEVDWSQNTGDFIKILASKEYGEQNNKLHYHAYVLTRLSESSVRKVCAKLSGGTGNARYSLRSAHNGTQGYVVKQEDIVCTKGFTNDEVQEIINRSRQYRTAIETTRKGASRAKEKFLAEVLRGVASDISDNRLTPAPLSVMTAILEVYHSKQIRFPARATLETAVMTLLYKDRSSFVAQWYAKNISEYNYN